MRIRERIRSTRCRWLLGPLVSIGFFLVMDQSVVRALVSAEAFGGRPLPPFAEQLEPDQERWLQTIASPLAERRNRIFKLDPDLGWTNAPGGEAQGGNDTTNSRGFRGQREYAVPKPDGVIRLACYGESYTWGADVSDKDSYPAAMERIAPGLEAINLGVSAYGTDQALIRFRKDGADLEPDHVVIGIMVENIGRNVNRYRPLWFPKSTITCVKPRFVLENDALVLIESPFQEVEAMVAAVRDGSVIERTAANEYWHKRPVLRPFAISPTARVLGGIYAHEERNVESMWLDSDAEPYRVSKAILQTFHGEALARGAKSALIVLFPHRGAMHDVYDGAPRYWQGMLDELTAAGVDVLDATDALRDAHARSREAGKRSSMYTERNHLQPIYNQVVAQAILERLGLSSVHR